MRFVEIQDQKIPTLGLGTYQLEGEECVRAVRHALDVGYRHLDTAQAYGNEREVGRAVAESGIEREEIFLTSKVWFDDLHRADVLQACEESLERTGAGYLDLFLIHWPNPEISLKEPLGALQRLREQGKIRLLGVSNFPPRLLRTALDLAPVACDQVEYHPFLDQSELLEICREREVLLTAYAPVARNEVAEEEALVEIARAHGKTPAQVTLRWLLQQEKVAAIPRSSSREHREENFDVFDFELGEEEMRRIDGLARGERLIDPDFAPAW